MEELKGRSATMDIVRESPEMEQPSELTAAIEDALVAFNDPALTPAARVSLAVRQVANMGIHPGHHATVAQKVREFKPIALELLRNMDYSGLQAAVNKFLTPIIYGGFVNPPVVKSQRKVWEPVLARLWRGDGPERDTIWRVLKSDETIVAANWKGCTIAGPNGEQRTVTREALRLLSKPAHRDPQQWISQWTAIRDPDAAVARPPVVYSERYE